MIHPAIDPQILAVHSLDKFNRPRTQENIDILVNKLKYHCMTDARFKRKLNGNPETARDLIVVFFDNWVQGGMIENPMPHQQGMEGLIQEVRAIFERDPDQFEFAVSPYIATPHIRVTLLHHLTGDKVMPKQATPYFTTQVLRSKFNQLTLF